MKICPRQSRLSLNGVGSRESHPGFGWRSGADCRRLAATIFQLFVASDTASDTLAALKRIHGLMPYFVLKGILRISNPMAMIRGVLDLFLARPFGGQSLLQR